MSRDWTAEELQAASAAMKAMGHMGYEEFCESLKEVRRMELRVNLNGKNRIAITRFIRLDLPSR